jgi:hypothetical protein
MTIFARTDIRRQIGESSGYFLKWQRFARSKWQRLALFNFTLMRLASAQVAALMNHRISLPLVLS